MDADQLPAPIFLFYNTNSQELKSATGKQIPISVFQPARPQYDTHA
jgi:hypothetical protein